LPTSGKVFYKTFTDEQPEIGSFTLAAVNAQQSRFLTCPHCRAALEVRGRRPRCPGCYARIDPETAPLAFTSTVKADGAYVGTKPLPGYERTHNPALTDQFEHIDNSIGSMLSAF
jgi:hypothetical protein